MKLINMVCLRRTEWVRLMSDEIDRGELRQLLIVIYNDGKKTWRENKEENELIARRGTGEARAVQKIADHFELEIGDTDE